MLGSGLEVPGSTGHRSSSRPTTLHGFQAVPPHPRGRSRGNEEPGGGGG